MQLYDAEQLAHRLMREFECDGWAFRWTYGKRQCGCASHKRNRRTGEITDRHLGLSRHLVGLNEFDVVNNTIRHEIAHIKAGLDNGHNHVWRAWCLRTGARPERCTSSANMPDPAWKAICTLCDAVLARRHRRTKKLHRAYCNHCGPTSIGKIVWREAA